MSYLQWMQPRDHRAAARTVVTLSVVAAVVTIVFAPIEPTTTHVSGVELALTVALAVVAAVFGWLSHYLNATDHIAWAVWPPLAVVLIGFVDFLTHDASISAQVFFFFPTLYGASQLRRSGACVMTAASVLGEVVVVGSMMPPRSAVVAIGYVTAALVTAAALLVRAGERQSLLIEKLERQAAIDPLTGLVTRRVLDEAAQSAITGAASGQGTSLILLDVDDFKSINDRFGHPAGDEVLVQLAGLLIDSSRGEDVVSRMGGDEIALLLPGCPAAALRDRAEQIVWDVRARTFLVNDDEHLNVSVSVGIAHAPTHAVDLRTLYTAADAALYNAKRAGRNRAAAPLDVPIEVAVEVVDDVGLAGAHAD
jgi:diguanylate cyclase (GGDEF)-like protein